MRINPKEIGVNKEKFRHFNSQVSAMYQRSISCLSAANITSIWNEFDQLHFYTNKGFNIMDLLVFCIQEIKPCKVWLSSFSLSAHVVNQLHMLYSNESIRELNLMIDWRVKLSRPDLVFELQKIADKVVLNDNHSKLILITNAEDKCYTIVSSANLNNNNRNEAGIITRDREVFNFYHEIFETEITKYDNTYGSTNG